MEGTGHHERAGVERSSLYVVATPIGNLADITLRALEVLKRVDMIAAEDTRVTGRLLRHYDISASLIALHQHNERRTAQKILQLLAQGKSVALVSDAGTPAISDPGAVVVALTRAAGHPVVPLPGACAAACALSASGRIEQHFLFYGFLPHSAAARRRELAALQALPYLLVFYEAPHRVIASIGDMAATFGAGRALTIARELTKLFETIHHCRLGEAAAWLAADANRGKGEFVLLVEGAPQARAADAGAAQRVLEILLRELPLKTAVRLTAELSAGKRNELYKFALELKKKTGMAG
jgi:16S rRNA (cytidine1402-2'-O)-methyltransferase